VPVDVQQRLRTALQGLGAQVKARARRVVGQRNDLGGVDDPDIGAIAAALVQGQQNDSVS
jgi:hypothetical protein